MKIRFTIMIVILLSITIFSANSQDWRMKTGKDDANFYDIQKSFNDYWKDKNLNKKTPKNLRAGWKSFKRWEWYWEQRVYPSGKFPASNQLSNEIRKWNNRKNKKETLQDNNEWTNLGPDYSPGGYAGLGRINWIEEDPNYNGTTNKTIWIGAPSGGLWKSTDDGASWTSKFGEYNSLGISSLVIQPNNSNIMYIATGDGDASDTYSLGVLKSTDGGETWNTTGLDWGLSNTRTIRKIIMSSSDYNILYAATSEGIYKTTNAGTNWSLLTTGYFLDIEFKPNDNNTLYACGQYDIYRTTNAGTNWTKLTSGLPTSNTGRVELAVSADKPSYIYALYGYEGGNNDNGFYGLYLSTDAGDNWTAKYKYDNGDKNLLGWKYDGSDTHGQAWYDLVLAANPNNGNEIYVGGINIWKSTNSGTNWTIKAHWWGDRTAEVHADHHFLAFSKNTNRLYNGNDGGIYRSTNGGTDWAWLGSGLKITQFYRLGTSATNANRIIAGSQDNGTKLLKNGTWYDVMGGDGMECIIDYTNDSIMYGTYYYGEVEKSTDGGNNFFSINLPTGENAAWVTPFVMHPSDNNTLFLGYTNVWKSTNGGSSWSKISNWSSDPQTVLHIAPSNPNYIYTGTGWNLKYTSNGGSSWNNITLPINQYLTYLAIHNDDPNKIYATFSGYSSGNKVFYSTNSGSSWTNITSNLPNVPANTIVFQRNLNNKIFVGTDIGVFWKDDDNSNWQDFNNGLPNVKVTELEIHYGTSHLRASTYGRGLWDIEIPPSNEVSTPVLLSPNNGSSGIAFDSKLIWQKVPTATNYPIQISKYSDMSNPIFNSTNFTDTSFVIKDTLFNYSTKYYWRVKAKNNSTESSWSQVWNFKIKANIGTPTLTYPTNNATNITLIDTLKWNSVNNIDKYIVVTALDSDFNSVVFLDSLNSIFLNLSKYDLKLNTTYYWKVTAKKSGEIGSWSDIYKFKTRQSNNNYCIPNTYVCDEYIGRVEFNTIDKSSNCNIYSDYTDFITTIQKGTTYQIKITNPNAYSNDKCGVWFDWNQDNDFNDSGENYTLNTNDNSIFTLNIAPPANAKKGKTTMRVRILYYDALSPCETSNYGEVEDYSVYIVAAPLQVPQLISPSNNSSNQNINLALSWQSVNNAEIYKLQISKNQAFTTKILDTTINSTSLNINNLEYFTDYYWRVQAINSDTTSPWSSIYKFKTKGPNISLVSPSNNAIKVIKGTKLVWNKAQNIEKYQLQVSKLENFSSIYASLFTVDTSYSIGIYNSIKYFWRVRGVYGTDSTSWSNIYNFTVKDSLKIPQLVYPTNNSNINDLIFNIDWNDVNYAENYKLQLSENIDFSNFIFYDWISESIKSTELLSLQRNKSYYWRVLAADFADTTNFSATWKFTINAINATLTTSNINNITHNSAKSGGNISDDGGASVTARGVCWSINPNPTISNSKTTDGTGTGTFTSSITGLNPNTTYYVRAYATNSVGTAYGEEKSFKTGTTLATLTTTNISEVTNNSAKSGGNISDDGGANVTARGVCWSINPNPTISNSKTTDGTGTGTFTSSITGLNPNTTYYVRAYATNSVGTAYGEEKSFKTGTTLATLTTTNISEVTNNSSKSGGNISDDGGASVTARGVCWSINPNPTISNSKTTDGTGTGTFTSSITGLNPNTTYYVRAYATNSSGTAYGEEKSFKTGTTLATLTTTNISDITNNSSKSGGNISDDGGASVTARGVCWSINPNPTISNSKTTDGTGTGTFTSSITGLNPNTTYYVRAYATNSAGTAYGEEKSFKTGTTLATLTTTNISDITHNSAKSGGNISDDGGANVTARGVCWSINPNPTISNSKTTDGTGIGSFTSSITGLNPNTTYYVRAYATNSEGTAYGEEKSFKTETTLATLTTTNISDITNNSAKSGGNISDDGGANVTARGVCWSTNPNPTISNNKTTDGTGTGAFTSSITGLNPNTTYYVRAYATNSVGTAYGEQKSFKTGTTLATLTTTNISDITNNSAKSGGNISDDGGANVTARGVCWSINPNPTISNSKTTDGTGTGTFTSSITGLNPNTTYYVRAYATNSVGTAYGEEKSFKTGTTLATLTTTNISDITNNSSKSGGNISDDGGANVTARGVCWSINPNPTISNSKTTDGTGTGTFTSSITGLNPNTTYYVRAYATNSSGTAYGEEKNFKTDATLPTIITTDISSKTAISANSGGDITSDGGLSISSKGVCWSINPNPTISNNKTTDGTGTGTFTSSITGLNPNTTYYVRAYATNSLGTAYGEQKSFTTNSKALVPDSWDFTDLTGNNATVVLPKSTNPKIGVRDLVSGDAIGYFFKRNDSLICAGYGIWDNANMSITVWGDNTMTPIKDGFAPNERYIVKVWDCYLAKEYQAYPTYSQGDSVYSINGYSLISNLNVITIFKHSITLISGWNMISTYIDPTEKSMPTIWNNIKNSVNLVKDISGKSYIPSFNINQIGDWNKYQGYQVYMNQNKTLEINGTELEPENTPISLSSGWSMIPYLRKSDQNIATSLATLTSGNALNIAKDISGKSYIPQFNINQIGNMQPGQGYQVYLSKNATLTYPANSSGKELAREVSPMPKHLIPEYSRTGNSAVAIFSVNAKDGDEIGIFNRSGELIGSGAIKDNLAAVTIWGDNTQTPNIDGAVFNEELTVKYFNSRTNKFENIEISNITDYLSGNEVSGLNYFNDAVFYLKGNVESKENNLTLSVSPNPIKDNIEISIETSDCSASNLKIYDLSGRMVQDLSSKLINSNNQTLKVNLSNLTNGEYTIILTCGNSQSSKKFIIMK